MISQLDLPAIALAVRQPWAWAIVHGGKDIENRTVDAIVKGGMAPARIAVLASKGMTRKEYESAAWFMRDEIGIACPPPAQLLRGGIIGAVTVAGIVAESTSPWFFRQRRGRGLVLADPQECSFVPASGMLGYFKWERDGTRRPCEPALWMKRGLAANPPRATEPEADLFR
jgi:hypothetical protein